MANPLESLRERLQAASRSVAERASELGVLLVDYSKPGSAHDNQHKSNKKIKLIEAKEGPEIFWNFGKMLQLQQLATT